jgi:hypothetical protein
MQAAAVVDVVVVVVAVVDGMEDVVDASEERARVAERGMKWRHMTSEQKQKKRVSRDSDMTAERSTIQVTTFGRQTTEHGPTDPDHPVPLAGLPTASNMYATMLLYASASAVVCVVSRDISEGGTMLSLDLPK